MNTLIKNTAENRTVKPFLDLILTDFLGGDIDRDINASFRFSTIKCGVSERIGDDSESSNRKKFSAAFVVQQATERYFKMIEEARSSLDGLFTERDMEIILNLNCSPIFDWMPQDTVADMISDEHGLEDFNESTIDPEMSQLMEKLKKLTLIQNAVLVDISECFWRMKAEESFSDMFKRLKFKLATSAA